MNNSPKEKNDFTYKVSSGENLPLENFDVKEFVKQETLFSKPCQTHKAENLIYCFNCKQGICNYCRLTHQDHIITVKNNFVFKPSLESFLFTKIDTQIKNTFELSFPKKLYDFFYEKLDRHFKVMTENLEKYRVQRLKELHTIFEIMETKAKQFNNNYRKCKQAFVRFLSEGKSFFPSNYKSDIVFLQLFNIVNSGVLNEKDVLEEVKRTKLKTVNYEEKLSKAINDIEELFKENLKASSTDIILTERNNNPFEKFSDLIEQNSCFLDKFNGFLSKKKKIGRNHGGSQSNILDISLNNNNNNTNTVSNINKKYNLTQSSSQGYLFNKDKNNNNNLVITSNILEASPSKNLNSSSTKIKANDIALDKFTNLKIYESAYVYYIETGDYKFQKLNQKETSQIEKILEASELKSSGNQKINNKNMNVFLNPQTKINPSFTASSQLLNLLKVYADLNHNKGKLEKFGELENVKNNQNSGANTANSPLTFIEEEGIDYFQAISGTKTIQLYDYQIKKPFTVAVYGMNKNSHDYEIFPYGTRSLYLNEKIYIFGGKDFDKEYKTLLVYEITSGKISKLGEMLNARCYHSINYQANKNCVFIIGGEKNNTCEKYLIEQNTFFHLPKLNFPRANCSLFNYKNCYLYAFCGYRNSIIDKQLNTCFERLDLSVTTLNDFKQNKSIEFSLNWEKVPIQNNVGIELQFEYVGIMPITDSHAFLHGGFDQRSLHRSVVVMDFLNHKLISTEDKEFMELKLSLLEEAKFNEVFDSLIK